MRSNTSLSELQDLSQSKTIAHMYGGAQGGWLWLLHFRLKCKCYTWLRMRPQAHSSEVELLEYFYLLTRPIQLKGSHESGK